MKKRFYTTILLALTVYLSAAQVKTNRFADPILRQIYSAGYHRNTDSLLAFFQNSEPLYRKEAALFFASGHDSTAAPKLILLLKDPDKDVRTAAAFALGQIGSLNVSPALISHAGEEKETSVNRYVLEAIGQSASKQSVAFLSAFQSRDSLEEAGVSWGLYRATNRKLFSKAGSDRMAKALLPENTYDVRHAAAYYFSQLDSTVQNYAQILISSVLHDPAPNVRMGILRGLRKIKRPEVKAAVISLIHNSSDYRLRVDALSALRQFRGPDVKELVLDRLQNDPHISVRVTAAESILSDKTAYTYSQLMDLGKKEKNAHIKIVLLNAALALAPGNKQEVITAAGGMYSGKISLSERKELVTLLSTEGSSSSFLSEFAKKEKNPELLAAISRALRPKSAGTRNNDRPKQVNTYAPVNWNDILQIPADCKIRIQTKRGEIVLRTFVEEAPFTVAHFISLIRQGAFNGIEFYRVVPNFVNQTGGSKGPDYDEMANTKIRSEFKIRPHYERAVNMASAGIDTESSHFSIMLRSTPWNDYHYTVFAEVAKGMDVVNNIQMGDLIEKTEVIK
jgi:cyclophilin family peptidyl-prolyl cis-trans isomerase/HEAT repeat protein